RIALVVIRAVSLRNPLSKFKKGMMPLGRTIEEIFVDITEEKLYDPEEAEETVFRREIPNVKTLFHERNRQGRYKQTIQEDSLRTAFVSWGNFDSFVSGIINAIYNSAEVDRSEEHTSELQSRFDLVCRLRLDNKKQGDQGDQDEQR